MKKLTEPLSSSNVIRLPGWRPKDGEDVWLKILKDMAINRNQWRTCCDNILSTHTPPKNIKLT